MKAIIHGMKRNKDNISFLELGAVKLREGSYNDVFLISSIHSLLVEKSSGLHSTHLGHQFGAIKPFVLFLPYRVLNEVTCISIISSNCPDIPIPVVHAFATDTSSPFIAEEHLHGKPLSSHWFRFCENEK